MLAAFLLIYNNIVIKFYKKEEGITFIEMIVYTAIFSIIFAILTGFIVWVYQANAKSQAVREVANNTQRAMQVILREITESRSIYTPTASVTQLSLETIGQLPAQETSTYVDIFLCGNQICLKRESENVFALTSDRVTVSNLKFVQFEAETSPAVQVSFLIDYINPGITTAMSATSTAVLRGY